MSAQPISSKSPDPSLASNPAFARWVGLATIAVPLIFVLVFFFGPLVWLVGISFTTAPAADGTVGFTFDNYATYLGDSFYLLNSVWVTVKLAVLSTAITLVIGYVLAYYIASLPPKVRGLATSLIVVSLAVNIVIRIFGLNVLLMNNGLINNALMGLGLVQRPVRLMYTELGTLIGLVQIAIPYVVLPLIGVIAAIDPALKEAAQSVGANRVRTFFGVTLPLSIPGVIAGTLIVFTLNAAAFAIPAMMGGGRVRMMGMLAYDQASRYGNFPFAATIGICLFLSSLVITTAYLFVINRKFKAVR